MLPVFSPLTDGSPMVFLSAQRWCPLCAFSLGCLLLGRREDGRGPQSLSAKRFPPPPLGLARAGPPAEEAGGGRGRLRREARGPSLTWGVCCKTIARPRSRPESSRAQAAEQARRDLHVDDDPLEHRRRRPHLLHSLWVFISCFFVDGFFSWVVDNGPAMVQTCSDIGPKIGPTNGPKWSTQGGWVT